jgi:exodeoxyribonuclease V alpha subunit
VDAEAGSLATDFDGRRVEYNPGQLDGISLAYATTIHNSQGLEYAAIVVVIAIQHYPLLQR